MTLDHRRFRRNPLGRRPCCVVRLLVLLLAVVAVILVPAALGSVAAFGAPALGAQDRVGAFNPAGGILAGGRSVESPCSCRDSHARSGGVVVSRRSDEADRPSFGRAHGIVAVRMTRAATSWAATPGVKDLGGQVAERSTRTGNLILGDEDAAALDTGEDVATEAAESSQPLPAPNFEPPTNAPQPPLDPADVPPGWRVRVMQPTDQYPDGYWRLEKPMTQGGWQGIDPSTMKPGGQPETHIPLPPTN